MAGIEGWLIYKIYYVLRACIINCMRAIIAVVENEYYDKKLGIDTVQTSDEAGISSPVNYRWLKKIFQYLKTDENDVFVDIGSGRGRAVCYAATQKLKKIIGIEIDRKCADFSRKNINKLKIGKVPIQIINADIVDCDLREGTIFYMFQPFGTDYLAKILTKIKESICNNPRKIRIIASGLFYENTLSQDWLVMERKIAGTPFSVWNENINFAQKD